MRPASSTPGSTKKATRSPARVPVDTSCPGLSSQFEKLTDRDGKDAREQPEPGWPADSKNQRGQSDLNAERDQGGAQVADERGTEDQDNRGQQYREWTGPTGEPRPSVGGANGDHGALRREPRLSDLRVDDSPRRQRDPPISHGDQQRIMGGQDHPDPGIPSCDNHASHGRPRRPVLTDARLVQNQDRGAVRDSPSQCQASLLAARELVRVRVGKGGQAQHPEKTIDPGLRCFPLQSKEPARRQDIVADGAGDHRVLSLLGHPPEPGGQVARCPAVDGPGWSGAHGNQQGVAGPHQAFAGRIDTRKERRQSRLAGPTGTDDGNALTRADCGADILQSLGRGHRPVCGHDRHPGPARDGDRLCRHQHLVIRGTSSTRST